MEMNLSAKVMLSPVTQSLMIFPPFTVILEFIPLFKSHSKTNYSVSVKMETVDAVKNIKVNTMLQPLKVIRNAHTKILSKHEYPWLA